MKQIKDFLGNTMEFECMGCAISNDKINIPGGIIYNGKYSILGVDPEIPIPGFLVINIKRHVRSFADLEMNEIMEIGWIIKNAEKVLKDLNVTSEITLVQEERSKHLHVWIFPTHDWMIEKYGKGITYLRNISNYAQEKATEKDINETLLVAKNVKNYFKNINFNEKR